MVVTWFYLPKIVWILIITPTLSVPSTLNMWSLNEMIPHFTAEKSRQFSHQSHITVIIIRSPHHGSHIVLKWVACRKKHLSIFIIVIKKIWSVCRPEHFARPTSGISGLHNGARPIHSLWPPLSCTPYFALGLLEILELHKIARIPRICWLVEHVCFFDTHNTLSFFLILLQSMWVNEKIIRPMHG